MKRKIAAVAVLGLCVVMIAACGIRDTAADKKISDGVANGTIVETVSENAGDTTFFGKVRSFLSGDTGSGTDSSSNKRTTAVGKYEDTDVITALMEKQQEKKKKDRSGQIRIRTKTPILTNLMISPTPTPSKTARWNFPMRRYWSNSARNSTAK